MSELGELHEKINGIAVSQAIMTGMLKEKLPQLITKDSVNLKISEHINELHSTRKSNPPKPSGRTQKTIAVIVTALTTLGGGIWALVEIISR